MELMVVTKLRDIWSPTFLGILPDLIQSADEGLKKKILLLCHFISGKGKGVITFTRNPATLISDTLTKNANSTAATVGVLVKGVVTISGQGLADFGHNKDVGKDDKRGDRHVTMIVIFVIFAITCFVVLVSIEQGRFTVIMLSDCSWKWFEDTDFLLYYCQNGYHYELEKVKLLTMLLCHGEGCDTCYYVMAKADM